MSDNEYEDQFITSDRAIGGGKGKRRKSSKKKSKKRNLSKKIKNLEEKVRKLSRKKSSKKRKKSSKKRRKSSKRRSSESSNTRYFTLMTPDGRVIGGRYSGSSPQQAARKLRSQYFNNGNTTTVHLRQTSSGPNHNYTYVYKVKRRKVPATVYIKKLTGRNYMWSKDVEPIRIIKYSL